MGLQKAHSWLEPRWLGVDRPVRAVRFFREHTIKKSSIVDNFPSTERSDSWTDLYQIWYVTWSQQYYQLRQIRLDRWRDFIWQGVESGVFLYLTNVQGSVNALTREYSLEVLMCYRVSNRHWTLKRKSDHYISSFITKVCTIKALLHWLNSDRRDIWKVTRTHGCIITCTKLGLINWMFSVSIPLKLPSSTVSSHRAHNITSGNSWLQCKQPMRSS